MDSTEGRQEAQRIATDIAKDSGVVVFFQHLVQGSIDVAMTTTLTQCRWTGSHISTRVEAFANLHAQGFLYHIGCQLSCTGQRAVELAMNMLHISDTTNDILDEGLSFLYNQHLVALVQQAANQFLGQGVL